MVMSEALTLGSNRRKKLAYPVACVVLALLVLALLYIPQTSAAGDAQRVPDITIGIVGPMSGDLAHFGRYVREAVALAVEEWNEKGGILGHRIRLLLEDDRNDPAEAVAAAQRLVQAGVWGVIGHLTSAGSLPASAIYQAAGIPQITPSSTDPRLTEQGFQSLFRTCGRDDQQGGVAAEFALHSLRPRRVVILHDQTAYGQALAEAFKRRIVRAQRSPSVTGMAFSSDSNKELGSAIEAIKMREPDLVYFGGLYHKGGLLAKRLREQGIKATLVSGDGMVGMEFINLAGEAAAIGTYLTFAPDPMLLPSAEAAIKRFDTRYGAIGPYTLYAYDAAGALFTAIARAKPKAPSRPHLLRVSKILHRMTYIGALGRLRWDHKGDLVKPPYVMYQVKKGGSFQGWFEQVTDRTPTQ
jgi:branched-chain amino acid transport system substrate-binding protein